MGLNVEQRTDMIGRIQKNPNVEIRHSVRDIKEYKSLNLQELVIKTFIIVFNVPRLARLSVRYSLNAVLNLKVMSEAKITLMH